MLGPHVVPPLCERVVLPIVQLVDSITHLRRTRDAASNDLPTHLLSQNLFSEVRHDRFVDNRSITENGAIAQNRPVTQYGLVPEDRSVSGTTG